MTAPWLSVIGIGLSGAEGLSAKARGALASAKTVFGSKRQLELAGVPADRSSVWPTTFAKGLDAVLETRGVPTAVLATNDPMHFGVGASLLKRLDAGEAVVHPQPSAFSLAAARLGWPLVDIHCLSAHGRPLSTVLSHVQPGARLLILSETDQTPRQLANLLQAQGFGGSRLVVLEQIDGPDERIVDMHVDTMSTVAFDPFAVIAVECVAATDTALLPALPGLPDDAFVHDGQLTKREVRAVTIAALAPHPGAVLWDVGAGCGSVAIEWLRAVPQAEAIAFERDAARLDMIHQNTERLGTPRLQVVSGEVPATLADRPAPDAVFHGGAVADPAVFEACWSALKPGGRVVANAVTLEGEAALIERHERFGGDLVRMDISHVTDVGGFRGMRPRMAVMQWRARKTP